MTRYRGLSALLILACFMLAVVPAFATQSPAPGKADWFARQQFNPNSPRLQAARQNALRSLSGTAASESVTSTSVGWTSRHTLYVGCTNSPAGSTYPDIASALAVVVPYSTIKVCAGSYAGNNMLITPYVAIVGQGPSGAVNISCTTTVTAAPPNNNSIGVNLASSYDRLKNVTVNNCGFGVFLGPFFVGLNAGLVTDDEVSDSAFNGNYYGSASQYCDGCEVEASEFHFNTNALANAQDVEDRFIGNTIKGDGTGTEEGIVMFVSIKTVVKGNSVIGVDSGLSTPSGRVQYSDIENNYFNGNVNGVYLTEFSSGNLLEHNTADGNTNDGFFADATTGADAPGNQLPNRFLYNNAFGNGHLDYEDLTLGYSGPVSGTNHGTANYYHGNNGHTASPMGIVTHT